uniref:Uncharacterized protein n=1 Tax=Candidatus Kentrum sp. SD TaxID=2126332 RepID=A0A451BPL8_9GAMM|nr:MAG: hypothetical protein BECKSD772D_GA0070982_10915 [Candidatus Kentron sp. SD]
MQVPLGTKAFIPSSYIRVCPGSLRTGRWLPAVLLPYASPPPACSNAETQTILKNTRHVLRHNEKRNPAVPLSLETSESRYRAVGDANATRKRIRSKSRRVGSAAYFLLFFDGTHKRASPSTHWVSPTN